MAGARPPATSAAYPVLALPGGRRSLRLSASAPGPAEQDRYPTMGEDRSDGSFATAASGRPDGMPRVGVVLAAGRSVRLRRLTGGRSKLLLRLGGMALVERAVRTLLASGLERVVVVVGYQGDSVSQAVAGIDPGRVEVVRAEDWESGNGASLGAVEPAVAGEPLFALLCSDHVFGEGALDGLVEAGAPAVLVDEEPDRAAWEEGTRVHVQGPWALAFGKDLDDPGIDCGAFVLPQEIFTSRREAARAGDHSLAGAVTRLAEARPMLAEPIPEGTWWQDVDTPHDLRLARRALRRSLTRASDGPVAQYLNRPVSTRISMALAPLSIPPPVYSSFGLLLGIMAASVLAAGHLLVGGLLVQATSVIGGLDEEAARLQMATGLRVRGIEHLADRMGDAAIVTGLALWLIDRSFRSHTLVLLATIGLAWAVLAMAGQQRSSILGLPASTERLLGYLLGGRDGRLVLVTAWAVLGHPMGALVALSAAWLASVLLRVVLVRRGAREATRVLEQ